MNNIIEGLGGGTPPPNPLLSYAVCCMEWEEVGLKHSGTVEGTAVRDIMLDKGCTRTMVRGDLVSKDKILEGKSAVVRCAHGDTVLYPLVQVCTEVDGCVINTAASHTLSMAVLLGVDVPDLSSIILFPKGKDGGGFRGFCDYKSWN